MCLDEFISCPRGSFPNWQFRRCSFPNWQFRRCSFPNWQFRRWLFSQLEISPVALFPTGNFAGGFLETKWLLWLLIVTMCENHDNSFLNVTFLNMRFFSILLLSHCGYSVLFVNFYYTLFFHLGFYHQIDVASAHWNI